MHDTLKLKPTPKTHGTTNTHKHNNHKNKNKKPQKIQKIQEYMIVATKLSSYDI